MKRQLWRGYEDVPVELSILVATEVDKVNLPTGYKSVGDGIVYNEEWDETAEVKKSEREQSDIKEGGVEEIETDMGGVDQSEVEESDHFEDCE